MVDAICFYRPLAQRELDSRDILKFMWADVSVSEVVFMVIAALCVSLLGLVLPLVNQFIFSTVIDTNKSILLVSVLVLLCGLALSTFLITITKELFSYRIQTKMSVTLQSAVMGRLINLPTSFFKEHSSGDLAQRVEVLKELCVVICEGIISFGLTTLFSFIYIIQIFQITPTIAVPALVTLLVELVIVGIGVGIRIHCIRAELKAKNEVSAFVYAVYSGIQKIKLSGSENRVFAKWAQNYKKQADAMYDQPLFLKIQDMIIPTVAILGNVFIFYAASASGVPISEFMAFNAAFAVVSGAVLALSGVSVAFAYIGPILEMIQPVIKTIPEEMTTKKAVQNLRGTIELNNVTFQYTPDGPKILDNLNLKIKPGEYVAIVGKSGCGKSTLLRLLLGFEVPQTGAIYYDGMDLEKIELRSLRHNIGVVMQNGGLFAGDIYSNITISAPLLSLEDAWQAADMAGLAEDIRTMPMQMHTVISEGSGGVSGGQRQRIMIARAIAPKPRILMFDEATSALDNITQQQVSESLAKLRNTRIVIAHRLSTVMQCDRIIVLDAGRIRESGSYEELIQNDGFFAELVKRQRL
jgi:NHLM bacteriocin system ABC transporter ATP-binding protein